MGVDCNCFTRFCSDFASSIGCSGVRGFMYSLLSQRKVGKKLLLSLTYNANSLTIHLSRGKCSMVNASTSPRVLSITRRGTTIGGTSVLFLYRGVARLGLCNAVVYAMYALSDLGRLGDLSRVGGMFSLISLFARRNKVFIFSIGALCGRGGILNGGTFVCRGNSTLYT